MKGVKKHRFPEIGMFFSKIAKIQCARWAEKHVSWGNARH